jgi:hypothetical protein
MRSFRLCFCLAVVFLVSAVRPASAQSPPAHNLPPVIAAGLEAYRNVGLDQAFRAWLRNSPLRWEPAMAAPLHAAQEEYGTFQSWDVVLIRSLSPSTRILYLVFNYQQGPVFAKFVVYQAEQQGWIVTNLKFSLDEDAVLPAPTMQ